MQILPQVYQTIPQEKSLRCGMGILPVLQVVQDLSFNGLDLLTMGIDSTAGGGLVKNVSLLTWSLHSF